MKCRTCNTELIGKQKMYCSNRCRHRFNRGRIEPIEPCYLDECEQPVEESIVIEHPDLKKLQLTLRVSLCKHHKYLLREVA